MSKRYPNLKNNESAFPHIGNVDVFKYDNDLDYARFDYSQMQILVCSVPWDLSLIHIPSPRDRQKSRMPSSA